MDVVGDKIVGIFQSGGALHDDVVVNTYSIPLKSGRCIGLHELGVVAGDTQGMQPDPDFDEFIGLTIVAVETCDYWATCGIRLSNGSALVMGSPAPYYWGLYEETVAEN